MYIQNKNNNFNYEIEKLCRIFLPFEKIIFTDKRPDGEIFAVTELKRQEKDTLVSAFLRINALERFYTTSVSNAQDEYERNCEIALATQLFLCFREITGYSPEWGILTGVRPAKLYSTICKKYGEEIAKEQFKNVFLVNEEKISLCRDTQKSEQEIVDNSSPDAFSLYISIPFCPTRCSYCSFVSHSVEKSQKLIPLYVEKLLEEIKITAKIAKRNNLKLKTVYIGGGTPTTLSAQQIALVMGAVKDNFDLSDVSEYTVEAGRPDTITKEKLEKILFYGATRISINPQTMSDEVLEIIGRRHTSKQTVDCFNLARKVGFTNINMDLIAGLPGDTYDNFCDTVEKIISLNPENVTVHSLSFKRASTLTANGGLTEYSKGEDTAKMVRFARSKLSKNGILPYYMYRQSKTVGNLENVGYAKKGYEGLYNVYIMDETHTILACGASAVTKMRQPNGDYIERVFNYKYPYEYINNFDEIVKRKSKIDEFYAKYTI